MSSFFHFKHCYTYNAGYLPCPHHTAIYLFIYLFMYVCMDICSFIHSRVLSGPDWMSCFTIYINLFPAFLTASVMVDTQTHNN